jgi:streptogramin lyase
MMKRIFQSIALLAILMGLVGGSAVAGEDLTAQELDLNPEGAAYEIHADALGNLWISDYFAGELWRYDPVQDEITAYGVGGYPMDAHADGAGFVWWTDGTSLGKLDIDNETMQTWQIPGCSFLWGLTIDENGIVWIADSDSFNSATLFSFTPSTKDVCPYALPNEGAGYYPEAKGDEIWLGDIANGRIARLDSQSGVFSTWKLPRDSSPDDIDFDETGVLWYAGASGNNLGRLDTGTGALTTYDLPIGMMPGWVVAAEDLVWYSEPNERTFGILDPTTAVGDNLGTITPVDSPPYDPVCQTLGDVASIDVAVTTPDAVWGEQTYAEMVNDEGWTVYQLPADGVPWGVAVTDRAYVVDWNRQKLVRLPLLNNPPVAVDDTYSTKTDTTLIIPAPGVLANDSDMDGDILTALKVTNPLNGEVTLNADGSFTYTPAAGFEGLDSFTYLATDGDLESNIATVNITVSQEIQIYLPLVLN